MICEVALHHSLYTRCQHYNADSSSNELDFHIVIPLSKIRDRDWSHTHHMIWINNQCCPMHQHPEATFMLPGATVPSKLPGNMTLY